MGGQTALNAAMELNRNGALARHGVKLIGANAQAIAKGEDRQLFKEAMLRIGLDVPRSGVARIHSQTPVALRMTSAPFPLIIRPAFTLGGSGGGIAYNREELDDIADTRPRVFARERSVDRRIARRLEGIRDGGDARSRRQLCRRLLDRKFRSDGRAHWRFDHGRADADAYRPGISADARRFVRGHPRDRRRDGRIEHPVCGQSRERPHGRDRDESARLAFERAGLEGDRFPIAKIAAKLAVGYTLDEIRNDITRETPASFEPTIDYCVVKVPRFTFEKFPQADPTLTTQMKSVGEAMAIGRTFKEALQKALRCLEIKRFGLCGDGNEKRRRPRNSAAETRDPERRTHLPSRAGIPGRNVDRRSFRADENRSLVSA